VKCCHCQPKPAAVARLSLSTCSRLAKRGIPAVMGNDFEQDVQRSSPSMISPSSVLVTERSRGDSHEGQTRYGSRLCFKPHQYNISCNRGLCEWRPCRSGFDTRRIGENCRPASAQRRCRGVVCSSECLARRCIPRHQDCVAGR